MSAEIQALKEKLVLACQILANEGQGDFIWGHVTVRSPERPDHIFMKPHMLGLSDVQAEDVITVDIDGNKVEGKGRRHTEVFIHTEIMRARPDVQCVVHTHPPHCIVFGALGKKMQPIGHYGSLFCEALPVFDKTTDLITDQVWGRAVAEDLGDKHVLLLRNHGIVATGPYIEEAVMRALLLPNIRAGQLRALVTTGKQRVSALPDVPTVAESGFPGYEVTLWVAFMVPAATPDAIAARLHSEITTILNAPDTKETLQSHGYEPEPGPPEVLTERIRSEIAKWRDVVAKAGIRAE